MAITINDLKLELKPWVLSLLQSSGTGGGAGTFAPIGAQYLTLSAHANLTAERVLTPGTLLTGVDSGAGAAYTLAVDSTKLAITAGKLDKTGAGTLTLEAAGAYTLTVAATGTAALGTGTATQVAYWSGTNTITGNAALIFTAASGNLSSTILTATSYAAIPDLRLNGTAERILPVSGGLRLYASSNEALRIDSNSNFFVSPGATTLGTFIMGTGSLLGRLTIVTGSTSQIGAVIQSITSGQTANLIQINNATPEALFSVAPTGATAVTARDAATNTTTTALTLAHNTSGTAAAGFGTRTLWNLETSTTADTAAAALDVTWSTETHASRAAQSIYYLYDVANARAAWQVNAVSGGTYFTLPGGLRAALATKSADYTLTTYDHVVVFTATATATLPAATGTGQTYRIICRAGTLTIDANGSETIKGELTQTLAAGEDLIISDTASGVWE